MGVINTNAIPIASTSGVVDTFYQTVQNSTMWWIAAIAAAVVIILVVYLGVK